MIAMQYSFTLPADYDMSIIDRRIKDKGPLLDGFPDLAFKAYLSARKGEFGSRENLYSPFYVWQRPQGASEFLCGPGFAALTHSFGWPQVKTWIVWQVEMSEHIAAAKFATGEILKTAPYAPLSEIRKRESNEVKNDGNQGTLASVAGFEPTSWTRIRFRLWREMPEVSEQVQIYRVGHISLP